MILPARLGWLTTRVPNPDPERARGVAFLLRGNATVFSRGFGVLCDTLRTAGVWAEDLRCTGDRWVRRSLLAGQGPGWPRPPVALVGHSRGGRRAVAAAAFLARFDLFVDLVICVDVAFPPPVPANVGRAVHLYRSRRRLYPARPLQPAPGSPARIENVDLDSADAPFPGRGLHHLNVTASPVVQEWVARQVLGPASPAAHACSPPGAAGVGYVHERIHPR